MSFTYPPAPVFEGLTFLRVQPCSFVDRRSGKAKHEIFPAYLYSDADGELVIVAEDRFQHVVDKLIESRAFSRNRGSL